MFVVFGVTALLCLSEKVFIQISWHEGIGIVVGAKAAVAGVIPGFFNLCFK